jgi:hypothetical protein
MSTFYLSCPNFTVRLVLTGERIHKAAPIAKSFEGQPLSALTAWAEASYGGPVIVQPLSQRRVPSAVCQPLATST